MDTAPSLPSRLHPRPARYDVVAVTDTGRVRSRNEDAWGAALGGKALAIADGMGGHPRGDEASRMAVDAALEAVTGARRDAARERVARFAFAVAQRGVQRLGWLPGTTLVLAFLGPTGTWIAHVGDSRAYAWDGEHLRRLTKDHALEGTSVVTRCIGAGDVPHAPDVAQHQLASGTVLMLATDGLTKMLTDRTIAHILRRAPNRQAAADALVAAALAAGGADNVTILLARVP